MSEEISRKLSNERELRSRKSSEFSQNKAEKDIDSDKNINLKGTNDNDSKSTLLLSSKFEEQSKSSEPISD